MTDLERLLERVEGANGPNRGIDYDIWVVACTNQVTRLMPIPPKFTGSIEAIVALVETELPGWCWRIGTCCVSDDAWLAPDYNSPEHGARLKSQFPHEVFNSVFDAGVDIDRRPSGNLPLAICEAYIRVKLAIIQWEQHGTLRDVCA